MATTEARHIAERISMITRELPKKYLLQGWEVLVTGKYKWQRTSYCLGIKQPGKKEDHFSRIHQWFPSKPPEMAENLIAASASVSQVTLVPTLLTKGSAMHWVPAAQSLVTKAPETH